MIGLEAPGSFLVNDGLMVLLGEGPKHLNSMISGLLTPGEPLFIYFIIQSYVRNNKTNMDIFWTHIMLRNMQI